MGSLCLKGFVIGVLVPRCLNVDDMMGMVLCAAIDSNAHKIGGMVFCGNSKSTSPLTIM